MSSILVVAVVLSGIIGIKRPVYGCIIGTSLAAVLYYIFEPFRWFPFILFTIAGLLLSAFSAFFSSWFFSGFRGGKGSTGSSIIGGFGRGHTAHGGGRIILSDEERDSRRIGDDVDPDR